WTLTDLHDKIKGWRSATVLLVLVLGVVLCSSKMGWIALALLGPYILAVQWRHERLRRILLASASIGIVVFAILFTTIGGVRGKVTEAIAAMGQANGSAEDSSSARRSVWTSAFELISEAPLLGQGTGDVKNELIARYERNGATFAFAHRLNAHSQFVQTQVALGVVGSVLLGCGLLIPLVVAFGRRNHPLIVLLLCTLLNWSVESMLEVQAGVMSFMFFAMVLLWKERPDDGRDRIVLLTQYYPPETGAPQNRLHALAKQLIAHGAEVTVLTAMPNYPDMRIQANYSGRLYKREELDGVVVHRAWLLVSSKRSLFWRLCNYFSFVVTSYIMGLLVLGRTRLLMVESPPLFLGLSAVGLARAKGAGLVFNVSDLWPESAVQLGLVTSSWMIKASTVLEMWCYRNAVLITGQTMGIVRDIQQRCPDHRVVWIPNGVDLELMDRIRPVDRERFGIAPDAVVFAYAGIIGHAQGLEVILKAAKLVDDRRILFLLIGDGPERKGLQEMARTMELGNLRFIDPMPRSEVLSLVAGCDGAVIPLRSNPLFKGAIPSKIFEALALERPVILGVDGEARDLFIDQGGGGMYVEPEDAQALANAATRLAQDPSERERLGKAGARYVRDAFDRRRIGNRLWEAMDETRIADLAAP
ncbi:MAG: glycosyltransferase, partial [Flavobacteriales bacterium]|nr:glycosyltransferase [Flavobacteriales bacterium]